MKYSYYSLRGNKTFWHYSLKFEADIKEDDHLLPNTLLRATWAEQTPDSFPGTELLN